jgi:hypothetical protein
MIAMGGALGRLSPLLLAVPAMAGCTGIDAAGPGSGWSRAPDLSVYASMGLYGTVARDQSALCGGFSPVSVRDHWDEDFAIREAAVTAVLVSRHGVAAVDRAEAAAIRNVPCPDVPDLSWRNQYARLLRLLEMRLGLA